MQKIVNKAEKEARKKEEEERQAIEGIAPSEKLLRLVANASSDPEQGKEETQP